MKPTVLTNARLRMVVKVRLKSFNIVKTISNVQCAMNNECKVVEG